MSLCATCWTTSTGSSSIVAMGPLTQPPPRMVSDSQLLTENAACMLWNSSSPIQRSHTGARCDVFTMFQINECWKCNFVFSLVMGLPVLSHPFLVGYSKMKSTAWYVGQNLGSLIHFLVRILEKCFLFPLIVVNKYSFLALNIHYNCSLEYDRVVVPRSVSGHSQPVQTKEK